MSVGFLTGEQGHQGAAEGEHQGTTAGARNGQGAGQGIEALAIHSLNPDKRLRTAVEAWRQDGAQSPASVGVLLKRSVHHSRCDFTMS